MCHSQILIYEESVPYKVILSKLWTHALNNKREILNFHRLAQVCAFSIYIWVITCRLRRDLYTIFHLLRKSNPSPRLLRALLYNTLMTMILIVEFVSTLSTPSIDETSVLKTFWRCMSRRMRVSEVLQKTNHS